MRERDGKSQWSGAEPTMSELAAYIAETCRDLRSLTTSPRFRTISYLLDNVSVEAEKIARSAEDNHHR